MKSQNAIPVVARLGRGAVLVIVLGLHVPANAHVGPPYPIIEGSYIGPFKIAVWSNPDVGTGSFYVLIDPPRGGVVSADVKVSVAVQPVSNRLPERVYGAWREELLGQTEYKALADFDREGPWKVRICLTNSTVKGEVDTVVQVRPALPGRWELILFALPFAGVGILWFKVLSARTSRKNALFRRIQSVLSG